MAPQTQIANNTCVVLEVDSFVPWDNPDNLVSREVEVAVDTAVAVVFLPLLFIISGPTNLLNMMVFWRQGLKERINLCLFCLSLADAIYMLHSFLLNMDRLYAQTHASTSSSSFTSPSPAPSSLSPFSSPELTRSNLFSFPAPVSSRAFAPSFPPPFSSPAIFTTSFLSASFPPSISSPPPSFLSLASSPPPSPSSPPPPSSSPTDPPSSSPPSQLGAVFRFIVDHKLVGFRGFSWVSGFLSTLIACERCFCVVSPLRSKTAMRTRTISAVIAISSLLILAGFFTVCIRWSISCVFDPRTNTTSEALYGSRFYIENREFLDVLDGVFYGLVLPGAYVIVVIATTAVTLMKLRKMTEWRQRVSSASSSSSTSTSLSSRELALTRMLVGVSVLYVVCTFPVLALGFCIKFVPEFSLRGRYYNTFNLMVSVFELFSYINSSVNFFVYCFLGSRYKETLNGMFPCVVYVVLRLRGKRPASTQEEATDDATLSNAVVSK